MNLTPDDDNVIMPEALPTPMSTLREVATHAGVSVSTVSRLFNDPDKLTGSTRERVQAAVEALGYRPSRVARRLRIENGHAHMLGVVIPDIQNPFFADVTRGIEDVTREQGYTLLLCNSDEDAERQRDCLDNFRTELVDGVIVPPLSNRDADLERLAEASIPVVCVDRRLHQTRFDTVVSDNEQGAFEAVSHLLGLGHRRIGFIGGISDISTTRERRQGYDRALEEAGVPVDPALVREGDSRMESGRSRTEALLDLPERPTALFVGNNLMALGALAAVHERGLAIPDELAVVSYDDMPWAMALNPPLTAVSQPGREMGRRAAEMMLQRIADPSRSPSLVVLQPRLVVRRSCGAARRSPGL
jgi:LacI family transcriptional regulator/LacI family repressor for deo operon, udp, cdd, tsx, nupC, and nupG